MKRATDRLEELPATSEIDAVVTVASVGAAAVHGDQLPSSQLTQVVRHEALRFSEQLRQLPDRTITVHELPQEPPSKGMPRKLQEPRWIDRPGTDRDRLRLSTEMQGGDRLGDDLVAALDKAAFDARIDGWFAAGFMARIDARRLD